MLWRLSVFEAFSRLFILTRVFTHKMQKNMFGTGASKTNRKSYRQTGKFLQKGDPNGRQEKGFLVYFEALCPRVPQGGSKDRPRHPQGVKSFPKRYQKYPKMVPKWMQHGAVMTSNAWSEAFWTRCLYKNTDLNKT